MTTDSILSTLLTAAAFLKHAAQSVATSAISDAYSATKRCLQRKFTRDPEASHALELATAKPESLLRKSLLAETCEPHALANDSELTTLTQKLTALLPPGETTRASQTVDVLGSGNAVHVAGRDLIHTAKLVRRNTITPDERHVNFAQRETLRTLIREVAQRLANDDGEAAFASVHGQFQARFQIASYLLLPATEFEAARSFLRQLRARHRTRLRRNNPVACAREQWRTIFAAARELGWEHARVCQFAAEKLGLPETPTSLKTLSISQRQKLAEKLLRAVRSQRAVLANTSSNAAAQ
jgi:hypothetical protein